MPDHDPDDAMASPSFVQAARGALLALIVAIGLGTWYAATHGGGADWQPVPKATLALTATAGMSSARRDPPPPAAPPPPEMTFYLVGSPAQADVVQAQLIEDSTWRALAGQPPRQTAVVVVSSTDEEQRVGLMIANDYYLRQAAGQPTPRVVDLRAP